jgi:hypothetical protein
MARKPVVKLARKENKLRPYRVDYFDIPEMQKDRALVKSVVIRAVTAQQAKNGVLWDDPTLSGNGAFTEGRIIIRAYRFYKNTPASKEVLKPVEDLFTVNKAIEVMEVVEKYRRLIIDEQFKAAAGNFPADPLADVKVIDPGPNAWSGGLKIPIPTPVLVCPYGYTKEDEERGSMTNHNCAIHTNTTDPAAVESTLKVAAEVETACDHGNATNAPVETCNHGEPSCGTPEIAAANDYADPDHRIDLDEAAPIIHPAPTAVEVPNSVQPDDRGMCTQPAVFDDAVLTSTGENSAKWIDPGMSLWAKLALFGVVGFFAVIIVIAILTCGH